MKKLLVPTLIIFLAATALGHSASARSAEPTRGAPPDWVIHHPVPSDVDTDPQTLLGGFHWLLIDRQMNITTEEEYSHFAIRVTNGDGVQNMSDISIDFDPSYQTLVFHSVRLHRNGRVIDNLADHDIQTFQRETGMDQNLYDGSETAVINQENVRIGDIIEYSYTRTGINPIHEGDYFGQEYFQYSLPIHQFHIRLLSARDHPLYFTFRNGAPEPDRTERDGLVEYTWDVAEVPAHLMDDDAPFWYDPYPSVWISSLEDWSGVVGWALPHYRIDRADAEALANLADEIAPASKTADRILQTIRFVQDEIRYLGMEQGLGAYKPNQPFGVYERRFGDCKDKSLLLAALLRNLGLEADPVLVNTVYQGNITPEAATPHAFNHCIVRFSHEGKDLYVDPTLSNQGGDLKHLAGLPYGKGLVIGDGVTELAAIPAPVLRTIDIQYRFTLEEIGGPAHLVIHTTYTGSDADSQRDMARNLSIDEISRHSLDYISYAFQEVEQVQPVRVGDDSRDGENIFSLTEEYIIGDFWKRAESDSTEFYAEITPLELTEIAEVHSSVNRKAPFYLGPPLDLTLTMDLDMPEDWPVREGKSEIKGDAYTYESEIEGDGDKVKISYRYQRHRDFVTAEETPAFVADHDRIWDDLFFYLAYQPGLEEYRFSGFAAALVLASLLAGLAVCLRIHRNYDPAVGDGSWIPLPMGGVLLLLPVGLIINAGVLIYHLATTYINHNTWLALFSEEGFQSFSVLGTLLTFELVANSIMLVAVTFLLIQFARKRSSFPRLMSWYIVMGAVVYALDTLGATLLVDDPLFDTDTPTLVGEISGQVIVLAFWLPYLNLARRPRHTFVNRCRAVLAVPESPEEEPLGEIPAPVASEPPAPPTAGPALHDPNGIRIVRWPISMVTTVVFHFLSIGGIIVSGLINLDSRDVPLESSPQVAGFIVGTVIGFGAISLPPLIGALAILNRKGWARVYNIVALLVLVCLVLVSGYYFSVKEAGDEATTIMGLLIISGPPLVLTGALLFSKAARTFPEGYMSYRSSVPRVDSTAQTFVSTGNGTHSSCNDLVLELFRKIDDAFPLLDMNLLDQGPDAAALIIPEQEGVPRKIILDLQKEQVLNLTIGPVWLKWKPCGQAVVREEFYNTIAGLLSGQCKLVEYWKDREIALADILRKQGSKWVTAHRWSRDRWTTTRGMQVKTVIFGSDVESPAS